MKQKGKAAISTEQIIVFLLYKDLKASMFMYVKSYFNWNI